MVGGELADCILEGHERVVAADDAPGLGVHLVQLAERGAKSLVRLLARPVVADAIGFVRRLGEDVGPRLRELVAS